MRERLLEWYRGARRELPWRQTSDPYRIWVSEIMLQQTRVAAVIPYYQRFLERFPDYRALAAAPEQDLLAAWAGLGYYSRARNLQKAARRMVELGGFPSSYEAIRALPGIGDYTAAAVGSIAFGLPYAVLDGNVARVMSRLTGDGGDITAKATRERLRSAAAELLPEEAPGEGNQALMELGATVCLPREPQCLVCPVAEWCEARRRGIQEELPVKPARREQVRIEKRLLWIERDGAVLLWQRPAESSRLAGFWELPEDGQLDGVAHGEELGRFRHTITHHLFLFTVVAGSVRAAPAGFEFVDRARFDGLPLSTTARKALTAAAG